jgi:RecQ mediated genome instability protein
MVNISAPIKERYQNAPAGLKRCLKLSMTDGVQRVFGIEYRPIKEFEVLAPSGFKVNFAFFFFFFSLSKWYGTCGGSVTVDVFQPCISLIIICSLLCKTRTAPTKASVLTILCS